MSKDGDLGPMLAGRRVLITGGAAGIGMATARTCLLHGARVALLDRQADAVATAAAELGCLGFVADVANEAEVQQAVEAAADGMGGIDGVVNAAGVMLRGSLAETDAETWRRVLDVNLTGPYVVARAALRHLQAAPGVAAIVNVASGQALLPNAPDRSAYAASKGGLLNLGARSRPSSRPPSGSTASARGWWIPPWPMASATTSGTMRWDGWRIRGRSPRPSSFS